MSSTAALKAEGNALFSAKKFEEAAKKYTEAILAGDEAADPKGFAVLYANRAACRLTLKRYMDSCDDARKATDLDPAYAKAWARLAASKDALGECLQSSNYWKRALDALPKTGLKPAEETQRAQYQAGYDAAIATIERMKNTPAVGQRGIFVQGEGRLPWDLAAAILPNLRVQRPMNRKSSAWVIHQAYEDFMTGVRKMKQFFKDPVTNQMGGIPNAIVDLSNGIVRDPRTMHFTDNNFISQYNNQVRLEMAAARPWSDSGPEVVIREALERQRSEGWDSVRRSLSVTVRAWIMRGLMEGALLSRADTSLEFYKRALETLRGLREHWLLVPKEDCGVIFERSFMFGLRKLYLESMMEAYMRDPAPELLEDLLQESDLLILEVDETLRQNPPSDDVDPGFVSSFYFYPRGIAYAHKAFYYSKKAIGCSPNENRLLLRKAALLYLQAADCFPPDDEQHCWFLKVAIDNMLSSHVFPLRETLAAMGRLRAAIPQAKAIWERSSLSSAGLWDMLAQMGTKESDLRQLVEQGKFSLDACIGLNAE